MNSFHLVYYINLGSPSIDYSLSKAKGYLDHGVKALQFDLPSRNPYRETPFIKEKMEDAWNRYGRYNIFLEKLSDFRKENTDFEMQMVSYEDVLMTVGTTNYIDFCKTNNIKTCRIAGEGAFEIARSDMNKAGIDTLTFIDFNMPQKDIDFAVKTGRAVMLRNVREGMEPRDGMVSWKDRIQFLREQGVNAPIYATAGIKSGKDLEEAKCSGAQGAFVGSVLMNLWNDEKRMFALLDELEEASK